MIDRWKWAAIAAVGAALLLLALLVVAHFRLSSAEALVEEYAIAELPKRGFGKGKWQEPSIPDAPKGTKPIARVEGTVVYVPVTGVVAVPPTASPGGPQQFPSCDLDSLEVSINCIADVLATPSSPWARLVTSGTIRGQGQTRHLPERVAGRIRLDVAPSVAVKPLLWEVRTGLGLPGPSVSVGFTRMLNRRLGVYGAASAPISGVDGFGLEAGLAFRF